MHYLERLQAERLRFLLRSFPPVLLVGPRQCGKSTFARHALPNWTHLDLERPADLAVLATDLEGFFDAHPRSVVIDEAQRLPEVFSILRQVIDRSRGKGRFLLVGSASPALMRSISERAGAAPPFTRHRDHPLGRDRPGPDQDYFEA